MKIFITGHKGLLGTKLQSVLSKKGHEIFVDDNLDITAENKLGMFPSSMIDVVIHCAAKTNVDWCETNRYEAWKVNVEGTVNVVQECLDRGIKLVCISTDYVLKPVNFYALTKKVAEDEVVKRMNNVLVIRTSTLYGYNGKKDDRPTFVSWILNQKEDVKTVTDNITHPTLIDDIAENIDRLLKDGRKGIVNVVGKDCVSKHDFANTIIKVFGLKIGNDRIWSGQVKSWIAKRPRKLKLQNSPGVETHTVVEGLEFLKKQMEEDK